MKVVRCDNHPDREAVVTLAIRVLPVGSRPIMLGFEGPPRRYLDLCEECRDSIFPIIEEDIDASS